MGGRNIDNDNPTPLSKKGWHYLKVWTALVLLPAAGFCQEDAKCYRISDFLFHMRDSTVYVRHVEHKVLEAELEIYPLKIPDIGGSIIKNEIGIDYHLYSNKEQFLGGIRYFADVSMSYRGVRDMTEFLMYTEAYYGSDVVQLGGEVGSVGGAEYFSVGPQITLYDQRFFRRVSVIGRVVPDLVLGYEFTTQEMRLLRHLRLTATGMCRMLPRMEEKVMQVSAWFSVDRLGGVFAGIEYQ